MKTLFKVVIAALAVYLFPNLALGAQPPPSNYLYEVLASKSYEEFGIIGEPSLSVKQDLIDETMALLRREARERKDVRILNPELDYPPADVDGDGQPDTASAMLEVSLPRQDKKLLQRAGLETAIVLPWTVIAYTTEDSMDVAIAVPESFFRLYARPLYRTNPHRAEAIERKLAGRQHEGLASLVHDALSDAGFVPEASGLVVMDQDRIADIEDYTGPISTDLVGPSLVISRAEGLSAEDVVYALELAIGDPRVPDVLCWPDESGACGEAALQQYFMDYLTGATDVTPEDLMGQVVPFWEAGGTLQQWTRFPTMDVGSRIFHHKKVYTIEMCQHFYAGVALGTGAFHGAAMPCAVMVTEDHGDVTVRVLNTQFVFPYFFSDFEPEGRMADLFAAFPTLVVNDTLSIVNAALNEYLGIPQEELFPLR